MRKSLHIILTILILSSCGHVQNEKKQGLTKTTVENSITTLTDYSEEFVKHFQESGLTLKGDSILIPAPSEEGTEVVLIPKYILENQKAIFETNNGYSITIRQLNHTDIEFTIQYDDQKYKGKASLFPHFYLGMETVGFSDGEYVITHYYVTESDNPCLDFIGLGNQNIAEESSQNVYALVSVSGDNCEDELNELTNKKLKTVAKKPISNSALRDATAHSLNVVHNTNEP